MLNRISNEQLILSLVLMAIVSTFVGSIVVDRIVVLFILLSCAILGSRENSFVNPFNLFLLTPISLLIYFNFGDMYMVNLTHSTWLLGIINMVAFLAALVHTKPYKKWNNCVGPSNNSNLILHTLILIALGFIGRFIPQFQSILWMCTYAGIVCAVKTKMKIMYLVAVGLFLVSALGSSSKTSILTFAVVILFCYDKYFAVTPSQKKKVKILAVLSIVFMFFSFSFANKDRGHYDASEGVEIYNSRGMEWEYDAGLFMPYMYITNGWTNLQYISETQDNRTYGLWFLKPILGYTGIKDSSDVEYLIIPYSSFNTTTFIACGFKDFGYWLSILSALFLGFFVKKVYTRFLISRSPYDVVSYALVGLATLEMFFSNHFFMQSYPFTILIIMELYKWCTTRFNKLELENNN